MLCCDTPRGRHSRRLACLRSHVLRAYCNESKQGNSITLIGRRPNNRRYKLSWDCPGDKANVGEYNSSMGTIENARKPISDYKTLQSNLSNCTSRLPTEKLDFKWFCIISNHPKIKNLWKICQNFFQRASVLKATHRV